MYANAAQLQAHQVLQRVCDDLSIQAKPEAMEDSDLAALINRHCSTTNDSASAITLIRGRATIPLQGIDVPFHSTYLHNGIDAYRRFLLDKIHRSDVRPAELVDKFIPNVIGKPFDTSKEFVRDVAGITGSETMRELLARME